MLAFFDASDLCFLRRRIRETGPWAIEQRTTGGERNVRSGERNPARQEKPAADEADAKPSAAVPADGILYEETAVTLRTEELGYGTI